MRILYTCFIFLYSIVIFGQNTEPKAGEFIRIETTKGTIIQGKLISMDSDYMNLETDFGESKILRSEVKKMEFVNDTTVSGDVKDNVYSGSHYILSQSAFNLKKGQSYYENLYVFLNSFAYGVTDNFTIIGGAEAVSLLFSQFPVMYFTPKFSVPFNGGAFSISTTLVTVPQEDFATAGFLQGTATFGDYKNNFSIGSGIGYSFQDGFSDAIIPVTISGIAGVSDRLSLISENWLLLADGYSEGVLSFGVRIHSRTKQNSLSVALWRLTEDTGPLLAWPVISGTVAIK